MARLSEEKKDRAAEVDPWWIAGGPASVAD